MQMQMASGQPWNNGNLLLQAKAFMPRELKDL